MPLHIVAAPGAPAGVTNAVVGRARRFGTAIDLAVAADLIGRGRPAHPRAHVLREGWGRDAKHRRRQAGGNQERFHVEILSARKSDRTEETVGEWGKFHLRNKPDATAAMTCHPRRGAGDRARMSRSLPPIVSPETHRPRRN